MQPNRLVRLVLVIGLLAACGDGGLRPVWIASVDAPLTTPNARITVYGQGFLLPSPAAESTDAEQTADVADEPADPTDEPADPVLYEGEDAVLVGGIPARVHLRQDSRIVLEVPRLDAGPHLIVVWSGGTASNAFPIRILQTTGNP